MKFRDTVERMFWTVLAAVLGAFPSSAVFNVELVTLLGTAAIGSAVSFLMLVARSRLNVLPEPGAGLPGLATGSTIREEPKVP